MNEISVPFSYFNFCCSGARGGDLRWRELEGTLKIGTRRAKECSFQPRLRVPSVFLEVHLRMETREGALTSPAMAAANASGRYQPPPPPRKGGESCWRYRWLTCRGDGGGSAGASRRRAGHGADKAEEGAAEEVWAGQEPAAAAEPDADLGVRADRRRVHVGGRGGGGDEAG